MAVSNNQRFFWVGLALALIVAAWCLQNLQPLLEKARLLHDLRPLYASSLLGDPQLAWDAGWSRVCAQPVAGMLPRPETPSARRMTAAAALRLGDFPSAEAAGDAGSVALLDMLRANWTAAVEAASGRPSEIPPAFWGAVLYHAGQQSAQAGDVPTAVRRLSEAESQSSDTGPLASPMLAQCLENWGRSAEANDEWRRAAAFLPASASTISILQAHTRSTAGFIDQTEWIADETARPANVLNATAGDWTLIGFDVNADDVTGSALLRVVTYWRTTGKPGLVAVSRRLVRDLVANGSFDWDFAAPSVRPYGYPGSVYHNQVPISIESVAARGNVLCMTRPTREEGVGLEGLPFPLSKPAGLLVQGGSIRSPNGSGYVLGERWRGTDQANLSTLITSGPAAPADWTSFVGTVQVPVGATDVSVWLLNQFGDPGGVTCYDDLFLFEAVPPDIAASTG